jgi:hypothetical protein
LANLWASYFDNTLKENVVKVFLQVVEDSETRQVLENSLLYAKDHLKFILNIYSTEGYPVPNALTEQDIDIQSTRLFTDEFVLSILEDIAEARIDGYATALRMATRTDIIDFYRKVIDDPVNIYNETVNIMLSKGIYMKAPSFSLPDRTESNKNEKNVKGFLGKQKPLNSIEISHIFYGLKKNTFRKDLFKGFSQSAKAKEVREYVERGKEIASKHIEVFATELLNHDLPVSMNNTVGVIDSNTTPFSDRLMMEYIRVSNVLLASSYGKAVTVVGGRRSLAIDFLRLAAEVLKYADDSVRIMRDFGWLEEPPQPEGTSTNKVH